MTEVLKINCHKNTGQLIRWRMERKKVNHSSGKLIVFLVIIITDGVASGERLFLSIKAFGSNTLDRDGGGLQEAAQIIQTIKNVHRVALMVVRTQCTPVLRYSSRQQTEFYEVEIGNKRKVGSSDLKTFLAERISLTRIHVSRSGNSVHTCRTQHHGPHSANDIDTNVWERDTRGDAVAYELFYVASKMYFHSQATPIISRNRSLNFVGDVRIDQLQRQDKTSTENNQPPHTTITGGFNGVQANTMTLNRRRRILLHVSAHCVVPFLAWKHHKREIHLGSREVSQKSNLFANERISPTMDYIVLK
ncbi:hypothetical protein CLF_102300 [Clonorchis sinensis]|uniref:Uncharacterized protein n=1 Tax=Clonorchis sinensis TaxID=79923 RepID=G7YMZ9_CLOSI|nr:hypothetical protein CLF_102300 [Clonorchis sinensis]